MTTKNQQHLNFSSSISGNHPSGFVKAKNDARWESLREEIYHIYVERKMTLEKTIDIIETEHGFRASLRKWKDKLKEWNYDKYLSKDEMKFIVTKQEKRKAEGKETIFVRGGQEISSDRIEGFKRRKVNEVENDASPDAATPPNIEYHTPLPHRFNEVEKVAPIESNDVSHNMSKNALLLALRREMDPQTLKQLSQYLYQNMPDFLLENATLSTTASNSCMDLPNQSSVEDQSLSRPQSSNEKRNSVDNSAMEDLTSEDITPCIPIDQKTDIFATQRHVLCIAMNFPPCLKVHHHHLPSDVLELSSRLACGYFTSPLTLPLYDDDSDRSIMDRSTLVHYLMTQCRDLVDLQMYSHMADYARSIFCEANMHFESKEGASYQVQALLCQYYFDTTFGEHNLSRAPRYALERFTLAITYGRDNDSSQAYTDIQRRLLIGSIAAVRKVCIDNRHFFGSDVLNSLSRIKQEIEANKFDVRGKVYNLFTSISSPLEYLRVDRLEDIRLHSSVRVVDNSLDIISRTVHGLEDCLNFQRQGDFLSSHASLQRLFILFWVPSLDFRLSKKETVRVIKQIRAAAILLQGVVSKGEAVVLKPRLKNKLRDALVKLRKEFKSLGDETTVVDLTAPEISTVTRLGLRESRSARQEGNSTIGTGFDTESEGSSCKYGVTYSVSEITGVSDAMFMGF